MNKTTTALIVLILLTYVANCYFLLELRRIETKIDNLGKIPGQISDLKATTNLYGEEVSEWIKSNQRLRFF